jgi:hypothetical protein
MYAALAKIERSCNMHGGMARVDALTMYDLRPVVSWDGNMQPAFPRHRLGVRDAGVPQSGHMARLRVSPTISGRRDDDQEPGEAHRSNRLVAFIRLRGGTKHAR